MCWNQTVSMNTFLFGIFGIVLAAINNYDWKLLLFLFSFVVMQLVEYFIWININIASYNHFWTTMAFGVVLLQPLAAINLISDAWLKSVLGVVYLVVLCIVAAFATQKPKSFLMSVVAPNKHLMWGFLRPEFINPLLLIAYFGLFFTAILLSKNYFVAVIAGSALVISLWTFLSEHTWGSMWCWLSNVIILGLILKILVWDAVCTTRQSQR